MPIEGAAALSFAISICSLAFLWVLLFFALVVRLCIDGTVTQAFGHNATSLNGIDIITRTITKHFSTRVGRAHGMMLGLCLMAIIASGFWTAVDHKHRLDAATDTVESIRSSR